jgi:hypothetical protein
MIVNSFLKAQEQDLLPQEQTEKILGLSFTQTNPAGRELYGAINTLILQGRFSRTQMEQALCYSPTSYEESMKLWLSALPPASRSMYVARFIENKFKGIQWDRDWAEKMNQNLEDENVYQRIPPPVPLGDNRHAPKYSAVARIVSEFYELLDTAILLDGNAGDVHAPLSVDFAVMEEEYGEKAWMELYAKYFGFCNSDLNWKEGAARSNGRTLNVSELVLRTWIILYYRNRLSKTELEHAMVQGPSGMEFLFKNAAKLAAEIFPVKQHQGILKQALDLDDLVFEQVHVYHKEDGTVYECLECDYCAEDMTKVNRCSACHIACYCNRDCQKADWKRHKCLCTHYQNDANP